jgi:Sulfotransferase family
MNGKVLNPASPTRRQVVHIGQRKTATSWFQQIVRRTAAAQNFVADNRQISGWTKSNPAGDTNTINFADAREMFSQWRDCDVFTSLETLISYDHERMAGAIFAALPEAKILVTTRAPDGYLRSSYTNFIRKGGADRPQQFARNFAHKNMHRTHNLAVLQQAYGAERVCFLPYELILDDPEAFLTVAGEWFGADFVPFILESGRNVSPPLAFLEVVRRLNKRLSKIDPGMLERPEWRQMLLIATRSVGQADELWPDIDRQLSQIDVLADSPELPADLWPQFRSMAAPIEKLPLYLPYLAAYGFQGANA